MNNKNQILFDFKFNKNYLDHDYYLSSSNKDAYNLINCWPKWIKKTINLYGEKFSGKSHLSTIFEKKTSCIKIFSKELSNDIVRNFKIKQALIIEDLDENISENLLKKYKQALHMQMGLPVYKEQLERFLKNKLIK